MCVFYHSLLHDLESKNSSIHLLPRFRCPTEKLSDSKLSKVVRSWLFEVVQSRPKLVVRSCPTEKRINSSIPEEKKKEKRINSSIHKFRMRDVRQRCL